MRTRNAGFWTVQGPGWLLLLYLIVAQGVPAFDYDLGVQMGTQEPAAVVSEVGVAFWKGFALADLVIYIPLLAIGLVGYWRGTGWGQVSLIAALGITVYWPVVVLAAAVAARDASGWHFVDEAVYWFVLPLIGLWGAVSLFLVVRRRR